MREYKDTADLYKMGDLVKIVNGDDHAENGIQGTVTKVFKDHYKIENEEDHFYVADYEIVGINVSANNPKGTATGFLDAARAHMIERAKTYDNPEGERSMGKAVSAFNFVTGLSLKESEGWLLLQLLKDTRQWSKEEYHADSAEDCIAYAALKAEALCRGD